VLANDSDLRKAASYAANWGAEHLRVCDVAALTTDDIPGRASLCWASPPCKDLSLAGDRAGLDGMRSGAFWPFMHLMQGLRAEGRAPRIIVIENVVGLLSSHGGQDFEAIVVALGGAGYRFGAIVIDAVMFVPQSRERVFITAVDADVHIPAHLISDKPSPFHPSPFHPPPLVAVCDPLPARWNQPPPGTEARGLRAPLWWRLPTPPTRNTTLADILDSRVGWDPPAKTNRIVAMMTPLNVARLEPMREQAEIDGSSRVRALYRRTRAMKDGAKVSRWEMRDDDIAGCLRTGGGGSSIQTILRVGRDSLLSRRLTPREYARLQGLDDSYALPANAVEGYDLVGDGVAVPVVRHLAEHIFEPILDAQGDRIEAAE
jgi:DNA (cytosine-5)-methyltransferase 1